MKTFNARPSPTLAATIRSAAGDAMLAEPFMSMASPASIEVEEQHAGPVHRGSVVPALLKPKGKPVSFIVLVESHQHPESLPFSTVFSPLLLQ